ncbi:hypothetical protein D9756_001403 [Leucocoprinus leucothites]|uniref:JmjC domain-containing protein n=1 Tax=Leucocoprinus leucothites TaxID=201217 RepID=A0A8H5G4X5_9AGAR|nr:hypothetical protein D9756_001403 [Leucoagaricus leucothites]
MLKTKRLVNLPHSNTVAGSSCRAPSGTVYHPYLLVRGKRFQPVPRSSFRSEDLESQIKRHEESGTPFVVEGWNKHPSWPDRAFTVDFCLEYFQGKKEKINVRNVHTRQDKTMAFAEFVDISRSIPTFAEPEAPETERWYGKDVDCPVEWEEWLIKEGVLPEKYLPEGNDDLFALRPKKNGRPDVETLMCYFGVADTYTPCHKDLCASSGQNLMCYTEKGGSSFWFMTRSEDCAKVARYFQSLKHELDHETYVISVSDLAKAPFDVYITEQKLGDLVLVPPRSCHQVLNSGGMTMKMSWSRMTLAGLTAALHHELPLYRRVCRPEIYQIKSTIHFTLRHYTQKLIDLASQPFDTIQKSIVSRQLTSVLRLYDYILKEEYSSKGTSLSGSREESEVSNPNLRLADEMQTCDFCGADIFQSYFQCLGESTSKPGEEGFIVCPGCYVEGRTCACREMRERERQSFEVLFNARWSAIQALTDAEQSIKTFKGTASLREQRRYFAKPSEYSVFHAAMLLHSIRVNERQPSKQCRRKGESHAVPSSWTLNCKKCHSAKCYPHLLEGSTMHSMRALLLQEQDPSTVKYHEEHLAGFPDYLERKKELLASQAEGSPCPSFSLLMTYNALTFQVCQPVNHRHANLGWYDHLPEKSRQIQNKAPKKEAVVPMDLDSSMSQAPAPHSPGSESQRSVKNHAYVELKQPERRRRASGAKLHLSSPLSSASEDHSDHDELESDDDYSNNHKRKNPKRKYDTTDTETAGPSSTKRKLASGPGSTPRGVKKPVIAKTASTQRSHKRQHELHSNNDTIGNVYAPVFPVGPPTKKRRQEREQREGKGASDGTSTSSVPKPKESESQTFADSLGAAINQVRDGATKVRPSGSSSSVQDSRRKNESVKPARPVGVSAPPPPGITSSISYSSQTKQQQNTQAPILVNVTDLQDMVVKTADRVVRQMVGDVPNLLLAAHAAVSMMTGYAASGQFMNNNTQLQFPSMNQFAEAAMLGNANMMNTASSSNQGTLPGHQPRPPMITKTPSAGPAVVQDTRHQQVSKEKSETRSSGGHRTQSEAQPSSSTHPDGSGQMPRAQPIHKTPSGERPRPRRRILYDDEYDDDDEV